LLPYRKSIRDASISRHLTPQLLLRLLLLLLLLQFVHFHGTPASMARFAATVVGAAADRSVNGRHGQPGVIL